MNFDGCISTPGSPANSIISWEWDFTNDGIYDVIFEIAGSSERRIHALRLARERTPEAVAALLKMLRAAKCVLFSLSGVPQPWRRIKLSPESLAPRTRKSPRRHATGSTPPTRRGPQLGRPAPALE